MFSCDLVRAYRQRSLKVCIFALASAAFVTACSAESARSYKGSFPILLHSSLEPFYRKTLVDADGGFLLIASEDVRGCSTVQYWLTPLKLWRTRVGVKSQESEELPYPASAPLSAVMARAETEVPAWEVLTTVRVLKEQLDQPIGKKPDVPVTILPGELQRPSRERVEYVSRCAKET